jgi:hypothetical protein
LYTIVPFRIAPRKGAFLAGDEAGTAFQAAGVFHCHLFGLFIVRIEVGRAYPEAGTPVASGPADLMGDGDVALLVGLEGVKGKFLFYLHMSFIL